MSVHESLLAAGVEETEFLTVAGSLTKHTPPQPQLQPGPNYDEPSVALGKLSLEAAARAAPPMAPPPDSEQQLSMYFMATGGDTSSPPAVDYVDTPEGTFAFTDGGSPMLRTFSDYSDI